jgi:single-strand DNA-binding protein
MGTINRVMIMGIIGSHPELKFAKNGKPFVRLSLATHKRVKDENGNTRRETQWHNVMLWGKNAETCAAFCEKGAPLYIEGHLAPYTKDEPNGRTYHVAIVADQMQFIPGSKMANSSDRGEFESLQATESLGEADRNSDRGAERSADDLHQHANTLN